MDPPFERSEDGVVTIRDILVEPDLPTVAWYLRRDEDDQPARAVPLFARGRRLRRGGAAAARLHAEVSHAPLEPTLRRDIERAVAEARPDLAPSARLRFDPVRPGRDDGSVVLADGVRLGSRRLRQLLEGCEECVVFLASLGAAIEERIRAAARAGRGRDAHILEAVAASALLDLTQRTQRRIELIARAERLRVTHCQWPGFCDWPEEETAPLMARLEGEGAVAWRKGGFAPAWSFLGLMGLGADVSRIKNNPCRRCPNHGSCPQRIW